MAEELRVEPTRRVIARLAGFEDRAPHQGHRSPVLSVLKLRRAEFLAPDGRKCCETEEESSFHRVQRSTGARLRCESTKVLTYY